MSDFALLTGNCIDVLKTLPAESVHCVVTSPPYWGLRAYLDADNPDKIHELGSEPTPEEYVANLVAVFREVRRVLRTDGTAWVNLGDSYSGNNSSNGEGEIRNLKTERFHGGTAHLEQRRVTGDTGLKPKDLVGIPWRVAFALQADGWWLRSDIIWCLSGGTWVYARTQKGDMPMMIRDMARLNPTTVKLWNGERWTQVLGWSRTARNGDELEIVLRSGERISCTPTHKFPTQRGLLSAAQLTVGDILQRVVLPEPDAPDMPIHITNDAAWFAGLYIAEGSRSGHTIQISGHIKETERWRRIQQIVADYGGSVTRTISGNQMQIRVYGKMLHTIIDILVTGKTAADKGFAPVVWRHANGFIKAMVEGYLSGDGHYEPHNNRWRLGFMRNYNLERDLRTAAARLGARLVLKMTEVAYNGGTRPTFRGEWRFSVSEHRNTKDTAEIIEIRKARCREIYDIGVTDAPHVFSLATGILTHNSKPNPMPESVTDRPTKAHEYVFLLAKSARYFFDQEAVREAAEYGRRNWSDTEAVMASLTTANDTRIDHGIRSHATVKGADPAAGRNIRSVWQIATAPFSQAHFATFPPKLVEPCIKAGTSEYGVCAVCGNPWVRVVEKSGGTIGKAWADHSLDMQKGRVPVCGGVGNARDANGNLYRVETTGWRPTCDHDAERIPATVLDPFGGAGTTALVAYNLRRHSISIELNPEYTDMARRRLEAASQQMRMF